MKAFLISLDKPYPKTHDIKELVKFCMLLDKDFRYLFKKADKLTIYARNPDILDINSKLRREWLGRL